MRNTGRYILILVGVLVLWNTIIIKPLKLFAVFLHELGHAATAFVFGFHIEGFRVNLNESGYALVQTQGWLPTFMVFNAGYLGSLLFAIAILYLRRTNLKKFVLGALAILFLSVSIAFSGFSFTLLYAVIFAIVVMLLYMLQNDTVNDWAIDIFVIAAVAYAIYDIVVDTIFLQINRYFHFLRGWGETQQMTDAVRLAQMTGIPAIVWGILWLVIALAAVYAVLAGSRGNRRRR